MDHDTERTRTRSGLEATLQSLLLVGAGFALVVLVALALAAWVEHAA